MGLIILAIFLTLSISALCSLLEAFILSTKTSEIEALKTSMPRRGHLLEVFREDITQTSSAILTLNTIANTLGAMWIGSISGETLGEHSLIYISCFITLGILIFAEILPKNLGIIYRKNLQKHLVYPLFAIVYLMRPLSWMCKKIVNLIIPAPREDEDDSDTEIILLAQKSATEGTLSTSESEMVQNALKLDKIVVNEVMTPRTVVFALNKDSTVEEVLKAHRNIPFARIPVYESTIDHCVGLIRRRDIFLYQNETEENKPLKELMSSVHFIPDTVTLADALRECLKHHQQILVAVDEYGSTSGVITMEDIIEQLLGQEIFETDDVAINMREFARLRKNTTINTKKTS
ncbi:MAG: hypothetical protein B7X06_01095 [Verrucomicrobia bacterium 21-51-4]|nr:MAG: hypothetical protein B7X06_01095 [Verrucomicrobia bacterium 21-51-4]HQU08849.1 hemolysin family protein [Opitutales bacterium]